PDPEGKAIGYVDLVSERTYKYKPGEASDLIKLPDDLLEEEKVTRAGLVEDVQPSKAEIYGHLARNLSTDRIVPVFLGSALFDHGVRRLWKALRHETPAAAQTAERLGLPAGGKETVAQVIKTYHAPHSGKLSLARIWSGQVTDGMT